MKNQCLTLSGDNEKEITQPIEYVQTSSFIQKGNGDLKRRRQKITYKDIKLEENNYIKEIIRLSNNKKSKGISFSENSERQQKWSNTHYTTFKRKRLFDPYSGSNKKSNQYSNNFNCNSPLSNKTSSNSKRSRFCNTQRCIDNSNSNRTQKVKPKSIEALKEFRYEQLSEKNLFNKKKNNISKRKYMTNSSNQSQSKTNTKTSQDIELHQLKMIKSEIEAMIQLKLENSNDNQMTHSDFTHSRKREDKEEFVSNLQTSRTCRNRKYGHNIERYLTQVKDSNSNDLTKKKEEAIDLNKKKELIYTNKVNIKGNERYSQGINTKDSIDDIHNQIDEKHDQLTNTNEKKPVLKSQKRYLNNNTNDDHQHTVSNFDSIKVVQEDQHDDDLNQKEYLKSKRENNYHQRNNSSSKKWNDKNNINNSKVIEGSKDDNNDTEKDAKTGILNNDRNESNLSNNSLNNDNVKDNHLSNKYNNKSKKNIRNEEQFIDSKGNKYNLSDIYKIMERTHQMTIKSKTTNNLNENNTNPFNETDYAKLISFLNKHKHLNSNTPNSIQNIKSKSLFIEQSNEFKSKFTKKLFETLSQFKSELINQRKAAIQNRIAPSNTFTHSSSSQSKPSKILLTSRSQTKEYKSNDGIIANNKAFTRNHLTHINQLTTSTVFIAKNKRNQSNSLNESNYFLSKVKRDISSSSNKKQYLNKYQSLTEREINKNQYSNNTSNHHINSHHQRNYSSYRNKHSKNNQMGLMPVNNLNINYFLS